MSICRLTTVCSRIHDLRRDHDRIDALPGPRAVRLLAADHDLPGLRARHERPAAIADDAGVERRPRVPADRDLRLVLRRRCPSFSMSDAPPSSPGGAPSSAGWNTNNTLPRRLPLIFVSSFGDAHEHGRVRIVSAGVHDADLFAAVVRFGDRAERHVGALDDRQRIHVGAQRDGRSRLAGACSKRDHAGVRDAGLAPRGRGSRRCSATIFDGADLAVGKFRVLVKIASPGDAPSDRWPQLRRRDRRPLAETGRRRRRTKELPQVSSCRCLSTWEPSLR